MLVDYDKCIGCKYCAWACPYGVRELDEQRKVMTKCTLCVDRINDTALPEAERKPACVLACPTNARLFGDIHDPESEVSDRHPGERRLRADAGVGHASREPLSAAAQDRTADPRRRAHARRQSAQGTDGKLPKPPRCDEPVARRCDVVPREPALGRPSERESPRFGHLAHDADRRGPRTLSSRCSPSRSARASARRAPIRPASISPARSSSFALHGAGLVASFFHLGRPERAWRSASQWRTSWLSREVIVLPAFMAVVLAYARGTLSRLDGRTLAAWIRAPILLGRCASRSSSAPA